VAKKLNFTIRQTEGAPSKLRVQSHDILYKVSRDWTLRLGGDFKISVKATRD